MRKLTNIIAVLCVLSFVIALSATEIECADKGVNVIGAGIVKKGTLLPVVIPSGQGGPPIFGTVKSFEDQPIYIIEKLSAEKGVHRGGYLADGEGFVSDCPVHGREIIAQAMLIIPIEEVEAGNVEVKIF